MIRRLPAGRQFDQFAVDGMEKSRQQAHFGIEQQTPHAPGEPDRCQRQQQGGQAKRPLVEPEHIHAAGHQPQGQGRLMQPDMRTAPGFRPEIESGPLYQGGFERVRHQVFGHEGVITLVPGMQVLICVGKQPQRKPGQQYAKQCRRIPPAPDQQPGRCTRRAYNGQYQPTLKRIRRHG